MADFTVRVELHGAEWENYDALRVKMGEYAVSGDVTRQQVIARARRGADRSGCNYAILVTESVGARCALEPAV